MVSTVPSSPFHEPPPPFFDVAPQTAGHVHVNISDAAASAQRAFSELSELSVAERKQLIAAVRKAARRHVASWSRDSVVETGLGRVEDKIQKHVLAVEKTPGVEDLEATTTRGDLGICIEDLAPWGVIGVITPCTNPTETIINNAISMLSAGNSLVICPHPSAKAVSLRCAMVLQEAVLQAGGPGAAINILAEPSLEHAKALITHPGIGSLTVTGGPAVVHQAMQSHKTVVAAGPGNPPAVVDETADLADAARKIVAGASFDNNIVCVDEKQVVCVESVAEELAERMVGEGAYLLSSRELERLVSLVLEEVRPGPEESKINRKWVGKDASQYLDALGVHTASKPKLLIAHTDPSHPFVWTELLMPILPITTAPDADQAIALGIETERKNRHTVTIHSNDVRRITKMSRLARASIVVANGSGVDGLGAAGEGHTSFTIASPTGHGLTTARTFTRRLRTTAVGALARA